MGLSLYTVGLYTHTHVVVEGVSYVYRRFHYCKPLFCMQLSMYISMHVRTKYPVITVEPLLVDSLYYYYTKTSHISRNTVFEPLNYRNLSIKDRAQTFLFSVSVSLQSLARALVRSCCPDMPSPRNCSCRGARFS